MKVTIPQYARMCNLTQFAIHKRIMNNLISYEMILGVKMIDTEKYPPLPAQQRGRKKKIKNEYN